MISWCRTLHVSRVQVLMYYYYTLSLTGARQRKQVLRLDMHDAKARLEV
jgi:hypothetical protein